MKKILCFLAALAMLFLSGCGNINPAVNPTGSAFSESSTEGSETGNSIPDYINADHFARRSYELRYLFALEKFNSPDEIPINALVQYAFCHLYYDNLTDMPRSGSKFRQATAGDIKQEIFKQFGNIDADITKADLYNSSKQSFEMWEPLYGTDIFYDVSLSKAGENTYRASSTFYSDSTKQTIIGKTVLTVEDADGQILIKKLTSSK